MSALPTRERLIELLAGRGVLEAARAAGVRSSREITYTRGPAPAGWLSDGDAEGSIERHRSAHRAGTPSEAALAYGAGTEPERAAERLLALAELASETGLLRAVCPGPGVGSGQRPGSWGVEDLGAIAAARAALPDDVWVRPHWVRLGAAACQVAVAFGADDWSLPPDAREDPEPLAAAVGARAVQR